MSGKFNNRIVAEDGSWWYLENDGMGGFLNPPEHAEHSYSIMGNGCYMSLSSAIKESWIPKSVKSLAQKLLAEHPGVITDEWIVSVYKYFRHCYSKNGENRNVSDCVTYGKFWDNAEQEKDENPERHLGYLFVKQFDPTHTPRTDLF